MIRNTSACGCFTDKREKLQGKCRAHAGNKVAQGFTRVEVDSDGLYSTNTTTLVAA